MHRANFHNILADCVTGLNPDAIYLGSAAVGFEETADGVALLLADGIKSALRRQIAGEDNPQSTSDSAWLVMVSADRLPDGFMGGTSSIWVGPNKRAVVYFLGAVVS
tara:strand:+ start:770 stop:1090 length:321 start_codon:yes stop_codon:yes gene_type:complete